MVAGPGAPPAGNGHRSKEEQSDNPGRCPYGRRLDRVRQQGNFPAGPGVGTNTFAHHRRNPRDRLCHQPVGRNLRRQQTGTIVALVPNIGNPFFSNILEGIETVCAEKEINVLIADTQKPSMSQSKLQAYFSNNTADGIVILDGTISLDEMRSAHANLPPMVTAGEW